VPEGQSPGESSSSTLHGETPLNRFLLQPSSDDPWSAFAVNAKNVAIMNGSEQEEA
jgi:hypothetical protein